jgi:glycosyltransferase involved in cell wall biosynthesis
LNDGPRPALRILFLTHYFPPEGNAPAARVHEMAKRWVRAGHEVTVITGVPNHPAGRVYDGYRNRLLQREVVDGIRVLRVWTFVAANRGVWRRGLNFASFMLTASLAGLCVRRHDVLVATSPQLLCGLAGAIVSALRSTPFVLEIRDIWPESITTVGAADKTLILRLLEWVERLMYSRARRIVTVGEGYKEQLLRRGVPAERIGIVTNGVDKELFGSVPTEWSVRQRYHLDDRFVCAYVGTIGMAAGLEVVLRTASLLRQESRTDMVFLLVGDGAMRDGLEESAREQGLDSVVFTGRVDRGVVPGILAAADACLVHLRRQALFESVLPSKIFEAAAMGKPIILGVKGHAAALVTKAECGICIEPDDPDGLARAAVRLADDSALRRRLGEAGRRYVNVHFDRDRLSHQYLDILQAVAAGARPSS